MDHFLKDWGTLIAWLLSSGALVGAGRSVLEAFKKHRGGVASTDNRRRVDIVHQRNSALDEADQWREAYWTLRKFCSEHTTRDSMPDLPNIAYYSTLKEGKPND